MGPKIECKLWSGGKLEQLERPRGTAAPWQRAEQRPSEAKADQILASSKNRRGNAMAARSQGSSRAASVSNCFTVSEIEVLEFTEEKVSPRFPSSATERAATDQATSKGSELRKPPSSNSAASENQ